MTKTLNETMMTETTTSPVAKLQAPLILGVAFVLALLWNYFFFDKPLGIAFPIFTVLLLCGYIFLVHEHHLKIPLATLTAIAPLVFFATMVAVRASATLMAINVLATGALLFLLVDLGREPRVWMRRLSANIVAMVAVPFQSLAHGVLIVSAASASRTNVTPNPNTRVIIRQIVRGIFLAIPAAIVFLLLFAHADVVFREYTRRVIDIDITPTMLLRTFLVVVITIGLSGAIALGIRRWLEKNDTATAPPPPSSTVASKLGIIEGAVFLSIINLIFFLFLLVQFRYFFGGTENISLQGFTYAEYARRGFFELIIVSALSFLLLWKVENDIARQTHRGHHSSAFQMLATLLIVQVFGIMLSAFQRLSLYEQAYGFTELRFYSHTFIGLLAIVFLLLCAKIFIITKTEWLTFGVYCAAILYLVVLNAINPDAIIARYNIKHFYGTEKVDTFHLSQLSDDAVPTILQLLHQYDIPTREHYLSLKTKQGYGGESKEPWQGWNYSRTRAATLFRPMSPITDY